MDIKLHWSSILLLKLFFLFPKLMEPRVFHCLTGCDPIIRVVNKQFKDQIYCFWAGIRQQFSNTSTLFNFREIKFHVSSVFLKFIEEVLRWRPHNVVNSMYLIKFIISREEWKQGEHFKEDTANTPHIHFVSVITVCQKTLRSSVPPCRNVFGVRLLRVDTSAWSKIS